MNTNVLSKAGHSDQKYETVWFRAQPTWNSLSLVMPAIPSQLLSTKWEDNAVAHFFHNYASAPIGGKQAYLEFLPELFARNPNFQCLQKSLLAISVANLANVSSIEQLRGRSRQLYSQALQSVGIALQVMEEGEIDCLMASIFLLQKYEV